MTIFWHYCDDGDRLYACEVDYTKVSDYYKADPDVGYASFVYTDFLRREDLVWLRNFIEIDVREQLNIPFNPGAAAIRYEHSMGQSGPLPDQLLKRSRAFRGQIAVTG